MKNNEELGGNKGWAKQGVFPADGDGQIRRSASCAQLKAEQDLALTQDRQRSCLMSRPPIAPMPPTRGKIEADLSWVLQMEHPSTHSSDTGSSTLPQHERNLQRGLGASSFLVLPQSPRGFNAEEKRESSWAPPQAERLPRSHAPHFGQPSFPRRSHNIEQKLSLPAPSAACRAPRVAPGQTP